MKSRALFFNPTLLKRNFFRYSVLWAIYTGLLFLCTSLPLFNVKNEWDTNRLNELWTMCSVPVSAIYALICAACCFSYLNKTRSIYMMSAFPITRTKLYFTTLLQGLLFGILPELVVTLFNLLIAHNTEMAGYIWQLLAVGVLEYLFFYGMAVVCMVLTGKTAYGVFCYIVLSFGPCITESAMRADFIPLLYGIVSPGRNITTLLCPLVGFYVYSIPSSIVAIGPYYVRGSDSILGWYLLAVGAAGIVLMALGWLLYRKRQIENAGEAIAFRWLRPICKYAFTVFVSFVLGRVVMYLIFMGEIPDFNYGSLLVSLLFAGFVGYFCAEMMLKRSIRVFKGKAFLGYAVFALLLSATVLSLKTDLFGIVHRVPQKQEVSSFELTSEDGVVLHYDTPEDIELMLETHKKILADHFNAENENYRVEEEFNREVTVTYYLTDGDSFSRIYQCSADGIETLARQTKAIEQYYKGFDLENQNGGKVYDDIGYSYGMIRGYLNAAQMKQLAQCLEEDMEEISIKTFYSDYACGNASFYIVLSDGRTVCIPDLANKAREYLEIEVPLQESYYID